MAYHRKDGKREHAHGITSYRGPAGTVYVCPHCTHSIMLPKGRGMGRGYGLRTGGAAFSHMVAHINKEHADARCPS